MKKFGIGALAATILSVSTVSLALGFSTNPLLITSVEVDKATGPGDVGEAASLTSTFLTFSGTPNSKPSCTSAQSIIFGPPEHVRNLTSLATAAMLAGKKVKVYYTSAPGSTNCFTIGGSTFAKIAHLNVAQ